MDCARSAQTQSRIKYYFLQGIVKAPVGELYMNVFAVNDQLDSDLDNAAIIKYTQKVSVLLMCATSF